MKNIFITFVFLFFTTQARAAEIPFNFAYQPPGAAVVSLQASVGTEAVMARVCGAAGKNCGCDFLDADGRSVGKTAAGEANYEVTGNYLTCEAKAGLRPVKVRAFSQSKTPFPILPVNESLRLNQIMGAALTVNRVRSIYRYTCTHDYLQKSGTSKNYFDCSGGAGSCGGVGDPIGDFCLLRAETPYYLYSDNISSNVALRISDRFYNEGSSRLCGATIASFSCVGEGRAPLRQFGVYGVSVGMWTEPVQFRANPDAVDVTYGYAAKVSADTGLCPPGLVKRAVFRAEVDSRNIGPGHGIPDQMTVTEMFSPDFKPQPFRIKKLVGGYCDGSYCRPPEQYSMGGPVLSSEFTKKTASEVCVIPAALLEDL